MQPEILTNENNREVEPPTSEVDVPPSSVEKSFPQEKLEWQKWLKNFNFILIIITIMFVMYIVDFLPLARENTLKEPYFEILKTLLFTVSGYVFGRSKEE